MVLHEGLPLPEKQSEFLNFQIAFFGAFMRGNKPPVLLGEDKNFSI